MKILYTPYLVVLFLAFFFGNAISAQNNPVQNPKSAKVAVGAEDYLTWTSAQAENIGKSMRANGKAGSAFDFRVIHTDHAINYKFVPHC